MELDYRRTLAIVLVLYVVLRLTPFDEVLIAAAFAISGIAGVVVFLLVFALLFLLIIRRTA